MALSPASSHGGGTFNGGTITNGIRAALGSDQVGLQVDAVAAQSADLLLLNNSAAAPVVEVDASDSVTVDLRSLGGVWRVKGPDATATHSIGSSGVGYTLATTDSFTVGDDAGNAIMQLQGGNKVGFYNAAAVSRAAAIADAAGGAVQDTQARTALNSLLAAIRLLGLIAT